MSQKRRDNKGRVLQNGESQRKKGWLIKLQSDGRGYSTIQSVRSVERSAFQMAVNDDWMRKTSFEFQLATVVVNDSVTREVLQPILQLFGGKTC